MTEEEKEVLLNDRRRTEMTLEEKARKYVADKADKGNFDVEKFGKAYFNECSMENAYIAGAKENGTAWHKVADGDLPKENDKLVLCYCSVGYKLLSGSEFKLFMPVYAWTEIPRYEGDKK